MNEKETPATENFLDQRVGIYTTQPIQRSEMNCATCGKPIKKGERFWHRPSGKKVHRKCSQ